MTKPELQIFEFDGFVLDSAKRTLTRSDGSSISLTPKVFDTLVYLVKNAGRVIGKDELMAQIWTDSVVEENNLNQNISILRKVFGERPGEQRFIVTVAGHGYRFVPGVSEGSGGAATDASEQAEPATAILTAASVGQWMTAVSKQCPQCGKTYDDRSLNFCLDDGASLTDVERNTGKDAVASPKATSRLLLAAVFVVGLIAVIAAVFYFRRPVTSAVDAQTRTVAVLPFKPLIAENRNEALELGMADALISKLSGVEEVVVRPLSACRRFNTLDQDPLAAGRELAVESVLDGTIQNAGDRIRVSAKLLRTSDGKQLWSDQFDERFNDIFAVQDSISQKVASALRIQLAAKDKKHSTENLEAYQLYMKGRYSVNKLSPDELRASIPYFEKAIEVDPQYALAYTGLAKAYGVLGISGELPTAEAFPKAKAAEQMALQLDDSLGEAHVARCMSAFWYDWDWQTAENECRRSLQIEPTNADFHGHYAGLLSRLGRHDEALGEIRRSLELNPLDLGQSALEGQYLIYAGRIDDALAQLRKTSELEPRFWMSHALAASAYIEKGMFAEAIAEASKERELAGRNVFPFGTIAMALSGKREEAHGVLSELLESQAARYVSPYDVAMIYNALDQHDKAIEWLERAIAVRDPRITSLKVEPIWKTLRTDARYVVLRKRMNLE